MKSRKQIDLSGMLFIRFTVNC